MSIYPELNGGSDLPVGTRMMLAGDGSTTLMLQLLVGSELHVELVAPDDDVTDDDVSDYVASVFCANEFFDLAIRHSRLFDRYHDLISENIIVYRNSDRNALMPVDDTPFGVHTRNLGLYERRRVIAYGVTSDRFGLLPSAAPGRVYEIGFSSGRHVLVHEVFNPRFVLPTTADATGTDAPESNEIDRRVLQLANIGVGNQLTRKRDELL